MSWIDTHAHLAEESLNVQLATVLENAKNASVQGIVCVAVDAETSGKCLQIANDADTAELNIRSSVGIHPNYAHQESPGDWEKIKALVSAPKVVALGETGLDLYWDDCPFEVQKANFAKHWELSRISGLPVIIHMRECEEEMVAFLEQEYRKSNEPLRGIMHSFAGSLTTALRCLDFGLHISFAGMLTYKKSEELRRVASAIPLERLLVETDCPYLSPEPHRSKRPNEPCRVIHTAQVLADCKALSLEELSQSTVANTKRLLSRWATC